MPTIAFTPRRPFTPTAGFSFTGDVDFGAINEHPVSALLTGGFVIAAATSAGEISAAVFDAAGNPVVAAFTANQTVANVQAQPDTAALSSGGFVVTWTDNYVELVTGGGDGLAIMARVFDASGNPVTDEFAVHTSISRNQSLSAVTALAAGGFVVTWQDGNLSGDANIRAQIYDAAGQEVGGDFVVHSPSTADQTVPDITALVGGGFVATWGDDRNGVGGANQVMAQIFDATGTKVGGEFPVSSFGSNGYFPAVAALPSGGFVVAWPGLGRIFDANGVPSGEEFPVPELAFGGHRWMNIAVQPSGGFVISWFEAAAAGRPDAYFGQQFDADGNQIGGDFLIGDAISLAALTNGAFVAARTIYEAPAYQVLEGVPLDLQGTIGLTDPDAGTDVLTVTLSVDYGVLVALTGTSGAAVSGSGTDSVTITGTLAQIRALMHDSASALTFTSDTASPPSTATLSVTIDGGGGPAQRDATINIVDLDPLGGTPSGETLDGSGDALRMSGNGGDDTYIANADDVVEEGAAEGFDTVYALEDYALQPGQHVELLSAFSIANQGLLRLTGNEFDNILVGTMGRNVLNGGAGNDYLIGFDGSDVLRGGAGNDQLFGGAFGDSLFGDAGNDFLDGGESGDRMSGGAGDDVYIASEEGDAILEAVGAGFDIVYAIDNYTLIANQEVEILSTYSIASTSAMILAGNNLNNVIVGNMGVNTLYGGEGDDYLTAFAGDDTLYGNEGNDYLDGGDGSDRLEGFGGNDTLYGGAGLDILLGGDANDTYIVTTGDILSEAANQGTDVVYAIEDYVLTAGQAVEHLWAFSIAWTFAMNLTGNNSDNAINGSLGVNVLDGKEGNDYMDGIGGADTFQFTTALNAATNVDRIAGFQTGSDKIALDDAVFAGLAPGALNPNAFVVGGAAADADDRIIYNQATAQLFYDADGSGAGAQILFASMVGSPTLAAGDFIVI